MHIGAYSRGELSLTHPFRFGGSCRRIWDSNAGRNIMKVKVFNKIEVGLRRESLSESVGRNISGGHPGNAQRLALYFLT